MNESQRTRSFFRNDVIGQIEFRVRTEISQQVLCEVRSDATYWIRFEHDNQIYTEIFNHVYQTIRGHHGVMKDPVA